MSTYADYTGGQVMSTFKDRLQRAAKHAGVEFSPQPIARSLGIENRQTVDRWLEDSVPRQEMIFRIAATWKVDPVWLGTGEGDMLPKPAGELNAQEQELLRTYRKLDSKRRSSLYQIVKALARAVVLSAVFLVPAMPDTADASVLHKNYLNTHWSLFRWLQALFRQWRLSLSPSFARFAKGM